jgi:hypothetical protein
MNCCENNWMVCNQGRGCPVRSSPVDGGHSVSGDISIRLEPKTERRKSLGYGIAFALICIAAALCWGVQIAWPL